MRGFKQFFAVPPNLGASLAIRGIGIQERMQPSIINRPHGTGDCLIMFFYDSVWIGSGGEPVKYPAGTAMIWTPGRTQYYGNNSIPFKHTWIHCDRSSVRSILRKSHLPLNRPFGLSDPVVMERPLLLIHEELNRHTPPNAMIVRDYLEIWLLETARLLHSQDAGPTIPPSLLAIRQLIECESDSPVSLSDLAGKAHLSVSHFCAEFKRYFGYSAIDFLIRQRMHRAAYFLRDRNLRITEVARAVGYENLYHFSKMFKKHFGISPRKMRLAIAATRRTKAY